MDLSYAYPVYAPKVYFIVQKTLFIIPDTNIENKSNENQKQK